jgi:hypothetical protein
MQGVSSDYKLLTWLLLLNDDVRGRALARSR